jgi:hypothetical protein
MALGAPAGVSALLGVGTGGGWPGECIPGWGREGGVRGGGGEQGGTPTVS